MKKLFFLLFVIINNILFAKPPSFEFYFEPDEILIIEKHQNIVNNLKQREEKNKIHLSISEINQNSYTFEGVFTTYSRTVPKEKEFKKEEEYISHFTLLPNGEYIVEEKYKFPNLQSIPSFPEIPSLKEIPKTWEKPAKEVINLFDINLKITIPLMVRYTYLGEEEILYYGKKVPTHKIQYEYDLNHKVIPGNGPIKLIKGKSKGIIFFSTESHMPLYEEQNLFYDFLLKNNQNFMESFGIKTWYKKIKKIKKEEIAEKLNQIPSKENFSIRQQDRGISIDLNQVLFDFNSYNLNENAKNTLDSILEILKKYPNQEIQISGHTDDIGSENYNQELSEKRAKAVAEYLIQNGLSENQISYIGYGDKKPLYPNNTPENRAKNRRVEILIITE